MLASTDAPADLCCYAHELIGRTRRNHDPAAADESFTEALRLAELRALPVWRMRALHELGTLDMFDHAGTVRLGEARRAAGELGALNTAAVLDMHLAAASMFSFDLDKAKAHAATALDLSGRLGYDRIHTLSLMFLSQIHALRGAPSEASDFAALAAGEAPGDPEIDGSIEAGTFGMLALLAGDLNRAVDHLRGGEELLRSVPGSGPACYRGLYPLVLAVVGDPAAPDAIGRARMEGMEVNNGNRGLLRLADAVLVGRVGDAPTATALVDEAGSWLTPYRGWAEVGQCLLAEAATADGWDTPDLMPDEGRLREVGLQRLALRLGEPGARVSDPLGLTPRERQVLALVGEGLANKEIAGRLNVSPRTVEKHVESLLRKAGARSRAHLVAIVSSG